MKKYSLIKILIGVFAVISLTMQSTYAQQQHHPAQPNTQMSAQNSQMSMQNRHMQMMLNKLGSPDCNYDLRFIDMMIMHHEMAVKMSQDALQKAQHPELKQMAQNIIVNQTKEIEQMKVWRKQWYCK